MSTSISYECDMIIAIIAKQRMARMPMKDDCFARSSCDGLRAMKLITRGRSLIYFTGSAPAQMKCPDSPSTQGKPPWVSVWVNRYVTSMVTTLVSDTPTPAKLRAAANIAPATRSNLASVNATQQQGHRSSKTPLKIFRIHCCSHLVPKVRSSVSRAFRGQALVNNCHEADDSEAGSRADRPDEALEYLLSLGWKMERST